MVGGITVRIRSEKIPPAQKKMTMRLRPSFQFHVWLMLAMLIGAACHQTVPDAPRPSRPPSLTVADLPAEVRNRIPAAPSPEAEQRVVHLQQQFEQAQQAQLRARNSALHQRVDRVRAAGNLQTAMKQEIEALRNEIASQAVGHATEAVLILFGLRLEYDDRSL